MWDRNVVWPALPVSGIVIVGEFDRAPRDGLHRGALIGPRSVVANRPLLRISLRVWWSCTRVARWVRPPTGGEHEPRWWATVVRRLFLSIRAAPGTVAAATEPTAAKQRRANRQERQCSLEELPDSVPLASRCISRLASRSTVSSALTLRGIDVAPNRPLVAFEHRLAWQRLGVVWSCKRPCARERRRVRRRVRRRWWRRRNRRGRRAGKSEEEEERRHCQPRIHWSMVRPVFGGEGLFKGMQAESLSAATQTSP